jgi:galactarate dehydratase
MNVIAIKDVGMQSTELNRPAANIGKPLYIRMHDNDNVAIVVNDGGLAAGTEFPGEFVLATRVPQGHKIALVSIPDGAPIIRYDVVIGYAIGDIAQGTWIEESVVRMPPPRELTGLPISTRLPPVQEPLTGYTFQGYRNQDGSVATRNILAISTTVQCVSGVVEHAVKRIKAERGRCHRHRTHLRLWRGDRCAGREYSPAHAAQYRPEPELRWPGHGRQPGL